MYTNIVKLNLNNKKMMSDLMPLYFQYESDITNLAIEEMFNVNKPLENELYFTDYFSRGITTYLYYYNEFCVGFISFHIDTEHQRGYANGFDNYAHLAEIYVDKKYRKQNIARSLVSFLENEIIKLKINKVYLVDIVKQHDFWLKLSYQNLNIKSEIEDGFIFTKKLIP